MCAALLIEATLQRHGRGSLDSEPDKSEVSTRMKWFKSRAQQALDDLRKVMRFEGDGKTPETAYRLIPRDLAGMQKKVTDVIRGANKDRGSDCTVDPTQLPGMVGEMCKMMFLDALYGEKDRDYSLGLRQYTAGTALQAQVIEFPDGRKVAAYFDFSAFHSGFGAEPFEDRGFLAELPKRGGGELRLNEELHDHPPVVLRGRTRHQVSALELAVILILARNDGWTGGRHLFRETRDTIILRPFRHGASISSDEALSLSQTLRCSLDEIDGEAVDMTLRFAELFEQGGVTIDLSCSP